MAENSETSVKSEKRRTSPALSMADRLEILVQAAVDAKDAGLSVEIVPLYQAGQQLVAIVIREAKIEDGRVIAINGSEVAA